MITLLWVFTFFELTLEAREKDSLAFVSRPEIIFIWKFQLEVQNNVVFEFVKHELVDNILINACDSPVIKGQTI